MSRTLIFRQLFENVSCTYTYVLGCAATKKAVIIDPVIEMVDRDLQVIRELGLDVVYGANTHVHADHVTGTGLLQKSLPQMKCVLSTISNGKCDLSVNDGDKLNFGNKQLKIRSTPGHTDGCITFVLHEDRMVFTGDTLLIRGCGRTDFQQGNPGKLYDKVHEMILSLPEDYLIYPGHNYTGWTCSSVEEELKFNTRLTKTREKFIEIMKNLELAYPAQIDKAVPANMVNGELELMDEKLRKIVQKSIK